MIVLLLYQCQGICTLVARRGYLLYKEATIMTNKMAKVKRNVSIKNVAGASSTLSTLSSFIPNKERHVYYVGY